MATIDDVVSLIKSLGKKVAIEQAQKYEGVGIIGGSVTSTGLQFTLANNSVLNLPIDDWNFITQEERNKLLKIITNGLGDLYLSNDGSYKKPTMNNVINYNQPVIINSSDWIKIDDDQYSLTLIHGLNSRNIIPIVYNNSDKIETLGIQRDLNKLILESTQPISGMVVINYSTTDTNNSMNNIATIKTEYNFQTISDRDTYFTGTPIELRNGLIIAVGTSPAQLMSWIGDDEPSTYDNSKWSNQTGLIRGERGDIGLQGIQGKIGKSVYDFACEQQGFSGTLTEYLESINSCLGKFTSLADLKIAYPVGIDRYKFAIIETISGQVGIAFYETGAWDVTVFASTNGSSVVRDDKSISVNSMGNMELFGYENAGIDTIPCKYSDGTIKYLVIEKDNTNTFTSIASKEFVNEAVVGGLSIQNEYWDASTNTPDITTINTNGKSFAWIVSVAGTKTLGGNAETFAKNDLVIKTNNNGYLKIHNASVSWGSIIGDISQQTDLVNLLATYCKIDDTDTTSATKTYSIKHILSLLDSHRKTFIQSDSPIGMVVNDLWLDITNSPYTFSRYDGGVWRPIGKSAGTIINDWVGSVEYKSGEYSIHNSLLYKCTTTNTDSVFIPANWNLISGHIIRDNSSIFTKRSNLEFKGILTVADDVANDSTVIGVDTSSLVQKTTVDTLTNKSLDSSTTNIFDTIDITKKVKLDVSSITTGTTKTLTIPDSSGTIALTSNQLNAKLWLSTNSYKQYDLVTYNDGYIYQANSDIPANTAWVVGITGATWKIVNDGHVIKDGATTYIKRSNMKFTGGVVVTDDSINDTTIINVVNTNLDWTQYTPIIKGTTTNPSIGSNSLKALYSVEGKNLKLKFNLYISTAGTVGSGVYKITIPNGYTINTTLADCPASLTQATDDECGANCIPLGMGFITSYNMAGLFEVKVIALDSNSIGLFITRNPSTHILTLWGSNNSYLAMALTTIAFTAEIPLA